MNLPIYLDYNATTPVDPRVVELMTTYLTRVFGNAASKTHAYGRAAEDAVLRARNQVAALLNVEQDDRLGAREIVFTSGATEANNLAIKGVADQYRDRGKHIITQVTEHSSVLGTCKRLAERGYEITYLPVDASGRVSPQQLADAIRPDTILVSIMYANNETGVIQPMDAIGKICKERGVLFHTDATQALGKIPIDVHADGIDLLACSAHKLYGPKGVGALYVRKRDPRVRLTALIDGGGHERGFRSGTLNVPGIAALGLACEIAGKDMTAQTARLSALRDRLVESAKKLGGVRVNGQPSPILPHVANLSFEGVDGMSLLNALDGLAVSSGSACTSASMEASHVLRGMGICEALAHASIRFSLGRMTSDEEIEFAVTKVNEAIPRLRSEKGTDCEACETRGGKV